MTRIVTPLSDSFFNDGYWYVLSSRSFGGSSFSSEEMEHKLCGSDPKEVKNLLNTGVCLPLYFPGDCALDQSFLLQGDLSPQEASEWIGRIRWKINIPCGEFFIMGGAMTENFAAVQDSLELVDCRGGSYQILKLDPGEYLVEIYAFLGSMTFNEQWDELVQPDAGMLGWYQRTRPDEPVPDWMNFLKEEGYVDSDDFGLLEYLIRLKPLSEDDAEELPFPELDEENFWCGSFELRKPELCPQGIPRQDLLIQINQ